MKTLCYRRLMFKPKDRPWISITSRPMTKKEVRAALMTWREIFPRDSGCFAIDTVVETWERRNA